MPAIVDFNTLSTGLALGITDLYEDDYATQPRAYEEWLNVTNAQRWFDTDWVIGGLGSMPQKGIGGILSTDTILNGPTKKHQLVPYALAVAIEYELYRWEIYGIIKSIPVALSRAKAERYNLVAYGVLNNSFNANSNAAYQTFQSENIITTAHTRLDGGTWSNEIANDPGLSYLGLQAGKILMEQTVDERNHYIPNLTPKRIICSLTNEWIANEIVQSTQRVDVAGPNVKNLLTGYAVHASVYLSTAQYWWMQTDKSFVRMHMRMGEDRGLEHDADPRTMNLIMSMYCSFGLGTIDSRGLVGSKGGAA